MYGIPDKHGVITTVYPDAKNLPEELAAVAVLLPEIEQQAGKRAVVKTKKGKVEVEYVDLPEEPKDLQTQIDELRARVEALES